MSCAGQDVITPVHGPLVHDNLAVYFLLGDRQPGPTPLTLQEALEKAEVRLSETSSVNELRIETIGEEEVFLQAGDIVKGGWQDRTLNATLVLPPLSGTIPIASFCVESGRWGARGREDASRFAESARSAPSRAMKLAMHERICPSGNRHVRAPGGGTETLESAQPVCGLVITLTAVAECASVSGCDRIVINR